MKKLKKLYFSMIITNWLVINIEAIIIDFATYNVGSISFLRIRILLHMKGFPLYFKKVIIILIAAQY